MNTQAPTFIQADATALPLGDDSVNLVVTSPPYIDARTYSMKGARRKCDTWIDWMLDVVRECLRVCVGPVIINCASGHRKRCYQPAPEGLLYRAWHAGIEAYRPVQWYRVGIPGSGGKDWLRADSEYCLCFKRPGALPFFDVAQVGHAPKWAPGGECSHRLGNGRRVNQWGHSYGSTSCGARSVNGTRNTSNRPSHQMMRVTRGTSDTGEQLPNRTTAFPAVANPGNLLKIKVGGGHMGHPLAHDNEAPFPEGLPEFFIKGWTHPGDTVLDPFSGSGTTANVAHRLGRIGIGCDLRMSQCELGRRRFETPYAKKTKAKPATKGEAMLFAV